MTKINEKIEHLTKQKNKGLFLFIVFAILYVASVTLFIVFSNFHYETLLMVVGSLVSGLLLIIFLYFLLNVFLFSKTQIEFYKSIILEEENTKDIIVDDLEKVTISKNICLYSIEKEGKKIFFLPFVDVSSLSGRYKVNCVGNYIYEVVADEE